MSVRRLSVSQILQLIEGAESISSAIGLSVSEIINLLLSEPENERDEEELEETMHAGGR
jgi:hypothetical protein